MSANAAASSLTAQSVAVLLTADPMAKAHSAGRLARQALKGELVLGDAIPPPRPARPPHPLLLHPKEMPKRKAGSARGRAALLHALAHIELNAIDLALDIVARFGGDAGPLPGDLRHPFCRDWLTVARDEAKHFLLLVRRLRQLDLSYGDLPAHDGLWTAAERTKDDLMARLAIVPLVHEARGLDVQPIMIARLRAAGDEKSAKVLDIIARDEVDHVRIGYSWFTRLCAREGVEANAHYRMLVARHHGSLARSDFNAQARMQAGLPRSFYEF